MTTPTRIILYYGIAMIHIFTVTSAKVNPPTLPSMFPTKTYHSGDGITGVSSVAEVTSKDGKVSSSAGVKFYSPDGTKFTKKSDIMQPWTFSKKTKDGFAMGAVQVYPGSVMASAASFEPPKSDFGQINHVTNWPMPHNFYPHTFSPIMSHSYSPMTHRNPYPSNYMFKEFDPFFIPDTRNTWYNPYDPFNGFWH